MFGDGVRRFSINVKGVKFIKRENNREITFDIEMRGHV